MSSYLGISVLTLVTIVVSRNDAAVVNAAVWIRGSIVIASALLTFACTVRAAHGSRNAYRRVRIISCVMVVAIAVIVSLPGPFPLWMKIERSVCGLVLIGVIVVVNGKHLRALFARRVNSPPYSRSGPCRYRRLVTESTGIPDREQDRAQQVSLRSGAGSLSILAAMALRTALISPASSSWLRRLSHSFGSAWSSRTSICCWPFPRSRIGLIATCVPHAP